MNADFFFHTQVARRLASTVAATTQENPPPAEGHLPGLAGNPLLRSTRDEALATPGLTWLDSDADRETRKMNTYQAIRDAMRSVTVTLFDLPWLIGVK